MIAFLSLFLHVLISPFKTQAQLEAEIVMLRHQLNVLRRRSLEAEIGRSRPTALRLALSAVPIRVERHLNHRARDRDSVASDGLTIVLALEVALSWRSAKGSNGDSSLDP